MSKQISAVEWLAEQITTVKWKMSDITDRNAIIEQAKQMEKEQIIKCFTDVSVENCKTFNLKVTLKDRIDFKNIAEQYYKETFKSE